MIGVSPGKLNTLIVFPLEDTVSPYSVTSLPNCTFLKLENFTEADWIEFSPLTTYSEQAAVIPTLRKKISEVEREGAFEVIAGLRLKHQTTATAEDRHERAFEVIDELRKALR
jgi:hypothetical protein